jgi:hypothetical protein
MPGLDDTGRRSDLGHCRLWLDRNWTFLPERPEIHVAKGSLAVRGLLDVLGEVVGQDGFDLSALSLREIRLGVPRGS